MENYDDGERRWPKISIAASEELYALNFDKILSDNRFCAITKNLARSIQRSPYMTLGDFLKNLTTVDLLLLTCLVELCKTDDNALSDLLIITELLSLAEGASTRNNKEVCDNLDYLCVLLTCESLCRKGLVEINYSALSFGQDVPDVEVVRKL